MKTIGAILSSIINLVGLFNTTINVAHQSITNVGDAIIDTSLMVKAGVHTAKLSFDLENAKSLADLETELNPSSTK